MSAVKLRRAGRDGYRYEPLHVSIRSVKVGGGLSSGTSWTEWEIDPDDEEAPIATCRTLDDVRRFLGAIEAPLRAELDHAYAEIKYLTEG